MKHIMIALTVAGSLLAIALPANAQEKVAEAKVISMGLFKNGLVVVKAKVNVPGPGTYRLDMTTEPVHGTLWVESDANVEVSSKMREVEVPAHPFGMVNVQDDLAGKTVTLTFLGGKMQPITGKILKFKQPAVDPEQPVAGYSRFSNRGSDNFLIVQTPKGRMYINRAEIGTILVKDAPETTKVKRPVMLLKIAKGKKAPNVFVTYLAKGIAWAPSYLVDTSNPEKLSVEMASVIRNELYNFKDAELRLISGFPSVEFSQVTSPLVARMSWQQFFQQLSRPSASHDNDAILRQQTLVNAMRPDSPQFRPGFKLGAIPTGEGVDLHYQSIGKRSLEKGEAISLTVKKAKADYERIVVWNVATSPISRQVAPRESHRKDEMWDTLQFKNPFTFPMTTAPAMVVENGKFNGQRTMYWTNAGETTILKVTRSLSVRSFSRETPDDVANESVVVDNRRYTKIYLKGEIVMSNNRKEVVQLQVNHIIRGEIREIAGNPKTMTREETLESVNRHHNVFWNVTLQPGEEKRLTYKYSVLIYRG